MQELFELILILIYGNCLYTREFEKNLKSEHLPF